MRDAASPASSSAWARRVSRADASARLTSSRERFTSCSAVALASLVLDAWWLRAVFERLLALGFGLLACFAQRSLVPLEDLVGLARHTLRVLASCRRCCDRAAPAPGRPGGRSGDSLDRSAAGRPAAGTAAWSEVGDELETFPRRQTPHRHSTGSPSHREARAFVGVLHRSFRIRRLESQSAPGDDSVALTANIRTPGAHHKWGRLQRSVDSGAKDDRRTEDDPPGWAGVIFT